MGLCITLKPGEKILIGEAVYVSSRRGKIIKLLIEGPKEIKVEIIKPDKKEREET